MSITELRKKYPEFRYKSYSYTVRHNTCVMSFHFELGNITFTPKTTITGISANRIHAIEKPILDNLVFHVGLAEMPSYWKAAGSPSIIIEAGYLNKVQLKWWHSLFIKGMGQYFFENNIPFTARNFLTITSVSTDRGAVYAKKPTDKTLVPIGGGKDALVTYEILKAANQHTTPFALNPTKAQKALLKKMESAAKASTQAGKGSSIVVERVIDPKLLELTRKGYLNGHTPFSAYIAFLTTLCAALFDYKYIALSNERSSNEGNVQYLGHEINHQYSKTFEFEQKFRSYSNQYLANHIEYFSFLRPLYELQIAKRFSEYTQYFATFLSCNEAHKTNSGKKKAAEAWCGVCSKCLFVFASLYPFVQTQQLEKIFQKNLFKDASLIPLMQELTGERKYKPLECVGTIQESLSAFYLSLQKTKPPLPPVLKYFRQHISKKHPDLPHTTKRLLASWNNHHAIPDHMEIYLKHML